MRNRTIKLFISCLLLILVAGNAEAKWWIFGASEDEVAINYLYLNNASYDEMGPKATVYKEILPDGMILLTGKASVKKGKIGSVRITVNNKEKWEDAKFSDRGDFEFRFRAETGKAYILYVEVMDTMGKTNDIEATRKEVTVSEQNIQATIKDVLDKIIEAYRNEDAGRFMSFVSEEFAGDATNLDRAIRKDFSLFDNIDLRYTLNNVSAGSGGKVFVAISFARSITSSRSGKTLSDKGTTEFVFSMENEGAKVFSMKNPLIFGLSDAENVATGTVPNSQPTIRISNNEIILSDKPYGEESDGGSGATPKNLTVEALAYPELTLTFDVPASVTASAYKRVLQWSTSRIGPWIDDTDPIFSEVSLTTFTVHCRGEIWDAGTIYYRLALEKISSRERSDWSNVVSVSATR